MPNEYVNKVEFGNETVMDITDTTAETSDVLEGEVFYAKSGARSVGTLGDATQSTHGLMSSTDKTKLDSLATVASTGSYNDLLNKPDLSQYITTVPTMVGATSSENGTSGLVPAPTTGDVNKFLAGDGTYKSGGLPMVILSYGHSTWAEFEEAYNNNVIVYTRASSGSNPASGSQTRMAFMAYVNNATTPTEVEFQYYRSMNSHSATAMGDQVFVYKLTKTGGWSVTTRDASIKQIKAGTSGNLSVAWSSNVVTVDGGLPAVTSTDNGKILQVSSGAWSAATLSIPTKVSDLTNDSGYLTSHQDISGKVNSADLATVATSGDYEDLLNTPDLSSYLTSVPTMVGADSSSDGSAGLVPAPETGDEEKFLKGDGTWSTMSEMIGTDGVNDGESGAVPIPYAGDENKFLKGDGTWENIIVYSESTAPSNPFTGMVWLKRKV